MVYDSNERSTQTFLAELMSFLLENCSPKLLAWCSQHKNKIRIENLKTKQKFVEFKGAQIRIKVRSRLLNALLIVSNPEIDAYSWTHVKEIPNSNLLVTLHQNGLKAANMEVFDISTKIKSKKIYSLGEISGGKFNQFSIFNCSNTCLLLVVGNGDVTYSTRRNLLGAVSVEKQIAYHIFSIDTGESIDKNIIKLIRKSKWHPHYSDEDSN